ncbi:MAG TPA: methyltransferase domain-containing protein [Chloroflexota bacterium]|nr:methyltransferase domain-containing protein [Chloroflexota bacterium]
MRVAAGFAASNGPQNFLGAPWAEHVLRLAPSPFRERIALRVLSLSPHYFYDSDRQAEAERNRTTREGLVRDVLLHYLDSTAIALDYGCGPGYMAAAVAAHVRQVEAVDVSRGVLACARVLNGLPNIAYETPDEAARRKEPVDIAYSFAVVQHLTDSAFRGVLTMLRRRVRTGGTLLIHFPVADEEWRTEGQWRADSSVRGRAKMRFGLNCFGRSEAEMARLVTQAGFRNTRTQPLAELTSADPDVSRQRLLVASG